MCKGFVKIPRRLFETRWWNQKRVYSESDAIIDLYQSADRKNMVSGSRRAFAERWFWDDTRVHRFFTRLEKDGYIRVEKTIKGTVIEILDFGAGAPLSAPPSAPPVAPPKSPKTEGLSDVTAPPTAPPSAPPTAPPRAYKNDNIISCLQDEENKKTPLYPPKGTFSKPTIEEVRDYCKEKGYQIDAEQFWNFYESKGWMVGKNHMKNWKACCATWKNRRQNDLFDDTQLRNNNTGKFKDGFSW